MAVALEQVQVRNATWSDQDVLLELIREGNRDVATRWGLTTENCPTHPSFLSMARLEEAIERGDRYFLAMRGEKAIGCVGMDSHSKQTVTFVKRLAVLPRWREGGVGTLLLEHVIKQAAADGRIFVELAIIADDQLLRQWYERRGFRHTGNKTFDHLPFAVSFFSLRLR